MISLLSTLKRYFHNNASDQNFSRAIDGLRAISFAEMLAASSCPDCSALPIDYFIRSGENDLDIRGDVN